MATSKIALFEYEDKEIRATTDGRFSVFDVLVAFGCYPNKDTARITFNRISEANPEVRAFCSDIKFPGRGQRETPVADKEGIYQILMLCPGKRGAEFRKWAAGILADPEKAADHAIAQWKKEGRSDSWIDKRIDGKLKRYKFTNTLQQHNVSKPHEYAQCTDSIYQPVLGSKAKDLREERGIQKSQPLRDSMSDVELMAVGLAEAIAAEKMEKEKADGFKQCRDICHDAGNRVSRVFD